jgi:hypothetical protein
MLRVLVYIRGCYTYPFNYFYASSQPETHIMRQATQHDCLPSLLGDGCQWSEIVHRRNKYFGLGRLEQSRLDKNLLYRHDEPHEPTKEGPLSYVLLKSPFASVLAVSRAHPSLVSLLPTPGFLKTEQVKPVVFTFYYMYNFVFLVFSLGWIHTGSPPGYRAEIRTSAR